MSGTGGDNGVVLIQIDIATEKPLTGVVTASGAAPQRFFGWLGLLRALSEILEIDGR